MIDTAPDAPRTEAPPDAPAHRRARRALTSRAVLALIAAGAVVVAAGIVKSPRLASNSAPLPTARPERGDLDVRIETTGVISAPRAASLAAPPVGSSMQLVRLAPSGSLATRGDVVLAFDPTDQQYSLEQAESDVAEAEQQILKLTADSRVQAADDAVALLKARYAVRLAELAVAGRDLEAAIKAKQHQLDLDQARRVLAQAEDDQKTHGTTNEAALAVAREKREKARLAMQFARRNIESMTVTAPIDGLVVVHDNRDAAGNIFYSGMTLPEYREGDTVQPGAVVLEIVDPSSLELRATLSQVDRSLVASGTRASVLFDGLVAPPMAATATGAPSPAVQSPFENVSPEPQFDATFRLESRAALLRPGMRARVTIAGPRLRGVLHVPRQAVFQREGRTVVYTRSRGGFVPVPVKLVQVTESRAVVEGIGADTEVALVNPEHLPDEAIPHAESPTLAGGRP